MRANIGKTLILLCFCTTLVFKVCTAASYFKVFNIKTYKKIHERRLNVHRKGAYKAPSGKSCSATLVKAQGRCRMLTNAHCFGENNKYVYINETQYIDHLEDGKIQIKPLKMKRIQQLTYLRRISKFMDLAEVRLPKTLKNSQFCEDLVPLEEQSSEIKNIGISGFPDQKAKISKTKRFKHHLAPEGARCLRMNEISTGLEDINSLYEVYNLYMTTGFSGGGSFNEKGEFAGLNVRYNNNDKEITYILKKDDILKFLGTKFKRNDPVMRFLGYRHKSRRLESRDVLRKSNGSKKLSQNIYFNQVNSDFTNAVRVGGENEISDGGENEISDGGENEISDGGENEISDGGENEISDGGENEISDGGENEISDGSSYDKQLLGKIRLFDDSSPSLRRFRAAFEGVEIGREKKSIVLSDGRNQVDGIGQYQEYFSQEFHINKEDADEVILRDKHGFPNQSIRETMLERLSGNYIKTNSKISYKKHYHPKLKESIDTFAITNNLQITEKEINLKIKDLIGVQNIQFDVTYSEDKKQIYLNSSKYGQMTCPNINFLKLICYNKNAEFSISKLSTDSPEVSFQFAEKKDKKIQFSFGQAIK
jgi:hypothetical protein